jgi:hypothetical protein
VRFSSRQTVLPTWAAVSGWGERAIDARDSGPCSPPTNHCVSGHGRVRDARPYVVNQNSQFGGRACGGCMQDCCDRIG